MKKAAKRIVLLAARFADPIVALFCFPAALILKAYRRLGLHRFRMTETMLLKVGVFPIRDHYYEPLFNPSALKKDLRQERHLPAINLNLDDSIQLLRSFRFSEELRQFAANRTDGEDVRFFMNNGAFESGDADIWYSMIRHFKPRRIIEVGSGYSTLLARAAILKNRDEASGYDCEHTCIEPFQNEWLEKCGARIHRKLVEDIPRGLFQELDDRDFLFIDSSHIIRPQGDVLFEYLELIPALRKGVIVHIHDIFTPKDYLDEWVVKEKYLWNEQYLLEAFLSFNSVFTVLAAVNHIHHRAYEQLSAVCANHARTREPGSFYIRRVS